MWHYINSIQTEDVYVLLASRDVAYITNDKSGSRPQTNA
jgi:hypothetical protein